MIQQAIQYPALITYLKGFSNYTWLHYCDGRKILVAKSLVYFEKKLPGFFRVHKTALVNPHYITDFKAPPGHKMAGSITVNEDVILPVSRRRWHDIIDPMMVAMLKSSSTFQLSNDSVQSSQNPTCSTAVELPLQSQNQFLRQMWLVLADEMKGGLVRQLISERWPQWGLRLFETGTRLQNALSSTNGSETPAMIVLDGSEPKSILTLKSIKKSPDFRFIPTLLLTSAGSQDLSGEAYAAGANSVIVHPTDLTRFVQVVEKTFRYWLTIASAPYVTADASVVVA